MHLAQADVIHSPLILVKRLAAWLSEVASVSSYVPILQQVPG